jgi:hypothetical protein
MPTPCNIRYQKLKQLEAEFASLKDRGDLSRRKLLASEIVELSREFNQRHAESEQLLNGQRE